MFNCASFNSACQTMFFVTTIGIRAWFSWSKWYLKNDSRFGNICHNLRNFGESLSMISLNFIEFVRCVFDLWSFDSLDENFLEKPICCDPIFFLLIKAQANSYLFFWFDYKFPIVHFKSKSGQKQSITVRTSSLSP